jgi:hypothetical protein
MNDKHKSANRRANPKRVRRERASKYTVGYHPTKDEVLKSEQGNKFWAIFAKHDAQPIVLQARQIIFDFMEKHGMDREELAGRSERECAAKLFKVFKLCYGESDSDVDVCDSFIDALEDVRSDLHSEASKRTVLIDELRTAHASWPEIGALLIPEVDGDRWETLAQAERDAAVRKLKDLHKDYKKSQTKSKNPAKRRKSNKNKGGT